MQSHFDAMLRQFIAAHPEKHHEWVSGPDDVTPSGIRAFLWHMQETGHISREELTGSLAGLDDAVHRHESRDVDEQPADGISEAEVESVMQQLLDKRGDATADEILFYAAAKFERDSLKTLMEILEEGRLEVRLRPGGNVVFVNDYEWHVREEGE